MATQKPIISVVLDEETLQRVDDFMFKIKSRSRSKTIGELVKMALDSMEELDDKEQENFDPIEEMDKLMNMLSGMKESMEKKRKEGD